MDAQVVATLAAAGLDVSLNGVLPFIHVPDADASGRVPLVESLVTVEVGEGIVALELKTIPQLFTGTRVPPDFKHGPTAGYETFFVLLETTAVAYCSVCGPEYDREFERVYAQLRRRPASADKNPLLSYLRASASLYLSLRDVSQAEFEGVVQRLSRSAGTFHTDLISTNYLQNVARTFQEEEGG
jgi:hypothetical protein